MHDGKLSATTIGALAPGKYRDGGGLLLIKTGNGMKGSWVKQFQRNRKVREMGLGKLSAVSLDMARDLNRDADTLLARGIDPIEHRNKSRRAATKHRKPDPREVLRDTLLQLAAVLTMAAERLR